MQSLKPLIKKNKNCSLGYTIPLYCLEREDMTETESGQTIDDITTLLEKYNINYHFGEHCIESIYFIDILRATELVDCFNEIRDKLGDQAYQITLYDKNNDIIKEGQIDTLHNVKESFIELLNN